MSFLFVWLFLQGLAPLPEPTAVAVVRDYLSALQRLDAEAMNRYLADDFVVVSTDGTAKPYDPAVALRTCEWEREMHTEWTAQVIGADKSSVSVVLTERSDYYRLLGLGSGTQVVTYIVESGRIRREVVRFVVEEHGTQADAFGRFSTWLVTALDRREPALLRSDGTLIFDGKSAPRMRYWLERWQTDRSETVR